VADVSIRGVPDDVVAAIDERARRLGISRNENLRRALESESRPAVTVSSADLGPLAEQFTDLADPDVMGDAWS
jgi:plasmid stability protein